MAKNAHQLPVHNRYAIAAVRPDFTQSASPNSNLPDQEFTFALVAALGDELLKLPALEALHVLRDKTLAHSDLKDRPTGTGIKFADVDRLLSFGLDVVTIIGEGYIGTSVTFDTAPHFIVADSQNDAFSMERLLKMVGIEVKPGWIRHQNDLKGSSGA